MIMKLEVIRSIVDDIILKTESTPNPNVDIKVLAKSAIGEIEAKGEVVDIELYTEVVKLIAEVYYDQNCQVYQGSDGKIYLTGYSTKPEDNG